jgi:DNA-binding LacI/PurR family transcriptional regulator
MNGHIDNNGSDAATVKQAARVRPVSIRDVGRAAGVSYQTVSRVINDHPSVTEKTRSQVLSTIRELGFRPNQAARALAGGAITSLMVLTSNTTLYGYAATLMGIEEEARINGLSVGITVLESASPADVQAVIERVIQPHVAVIVLAYDLAGERILEAMPAGVTMVAAVESRSARADQSGPWAWLDDRAAARNAVRYLLDLGHATVQFVELPSSTQNSQRTIGWREALEEAAITPPRAITGGWDCMSGYRAGQLLARDPDVSAVLCGNDDLALGVMYALREHGRSVPDDVSVIGFDDMPQSAFLTPPLTTVRLDFVGLGRDCVTLLRGLLDPALVTAQPVARPCELIVRQSSGARSRAKRSRPQA